MSENGGGRLLPLADALNRTQTLRAAEFHSLVLFRTWEITPLREKRDVKIAHGSRFSKTAVKSEKWLKCVFTRVATSKTVSDGERKPLQFTNRSPPRCPTTDRARCYAPMNDSSTCSQWQLNENPSMSQDDDV